MVFSDTTNKTGIVEDIDFLLGGLSLTPYPLADKARNANRWYHKIVNWILESQDEWDFDDLNNTNYPIATANLVANQQDYTLPATSGVGNDRALQIQRVEVTYDGTNWYKAEPFELGERSSASDTTHITQDFFESKPFYDIRYNALWLYPIPDANVTAGLKIWFLRRLTDIFTAADTTQEPGFDEGFHRLLSYGAAYDFSVANNLTEKITVLRQEIELGRQELQKFYSKKTLDRTMQIKMAFKNYN